MFCTWNSLSISCILLVMLLSVFPVLFHRLSTFRMPQFVFPLLLLFSWYQLIQYFGSRVLLDLMLWPSGRQHRGVSPRQPAKWVWAVCLSGKGVFWQTKISWTVVVISLDQFQSFARINHNYLLEQLQPCILWQESGDPSQGKCSSSGKGRNGCMGHLEFRYPKVWYK